MSDSADSADERPGSGSEKRPGGGISMDKRPSATATKTSTADVGPGARPGRVKEPTPSVPIPRTIQWATIAIAAEILFTLVRGLSIKGYNSELTQWVIDQNNKAKNKKVPYTASDIHHDLDSLRNGMLIQGVVVCIALAILGVSLRRARGAGGARWALLIIIVLTSGPLAIFPVAGFPVVPQVAGVLMGVASIAVIVLILLPQSLRYFRACKAAIRPAGAPVRPGLGSLFGGGAAAGRGGAGAGGRPAGRGGLLGSLLAPRPAPGSARTGASPAETSAAKASANPARPKAKAKVRAETDAVAKGAELARTRAKASKSRRTDTS